MFCGSNPKRVLIVSMHFLLLLGVPSIIEAHHCGPTQPLPEYPRHSCHTHTQTWQPGETIDQHPGGAKGRGPGNNPPQTPSTPCMYYIDARRIETMLRAQPGVCQRYGPDRIICQANTSQTDISGSSSGPEAWKDKLRDDIAAEVEKRARNINGFDTTTTEIQANFKATGGGRWQVKKAPYSQQYWNLFDQVMQEFINAGRTRPPNNRP